MVCTYKDYIHEQADLTKEQLLEERNIFAYAIDKWQRVCVITDRKSGIILFANDYALENLGYTLEELEGKHISILVHNQKGEKRELFLQEIQDKGVISNLSRICAKDGTEVLFYIDSYTCNGFILSTGIKYSQIEDKLRLLEEKLSRWGN